MDIVYTFKFDPHSGNRQLIYSLRSLEKHLKGNIGKVFVIGADPELFHIAHIPATDTKSAAINIKDKLLIACDTTEISDDFLYIADDHYLLSDINIESYPVYSNGKLEHLARTQRGSYKMVVQETMRYLPNGKNYNIHAPIIYNKEKLKDIIEETKWQPLGLMIKSLYCNRLELHSTEMSDCKISRDISIEEMRGRIAGRTVFSTGREKTMRHLKQFMDELYPIKSKHE